MEQIEEIEGEEGLYILKKAKTNANITQKHLLYALDAMIKNMLDIGIDEFMITTVTAKALAENHEEE